MKWFLECLKKYAVFSGRSRRKEFWIFNLWNFLFFSILVFLVFIFQILIIPLGVQISLIILFLYIIAMFLPSLAVSIRRLHDTDSSGFWILLGFTTIGALFLIIPFSLNGNSGPNKYGYDPKGESESKLNETVIIEGDMEIDKDTFLYKKPSVESKIQRTLDKGEYVSFIDIVNIDESSWTQIITMKDQKKGWVLSNLLKDKKI